MLYPYGAWKVYKIHSSTSNHAPLTALSNNDIVEIKYSRGKHYLAVLTKTMLSIWRTKPRLQIMNLTRDQAFIETFGFHSNVVWKLDATMIVIVTDEGWVLLYRIMINTNEKLFPLPSSYSYSSSSNYNANSNANTNSNMSSLTSEPLEFDGYQSIFLQLITMFRLPALSTCIISRKESFLIGTNQGTIEAMAWPSNDGLIHHNTSSIRSTLQNKNNEFSNACIISMDSSPWIGYIGFVFDSGKCGLIHIPVDHIDNIFGEARYNFIFIDDDIDDATKICINSRFQFITVGRKSGQLKSYRFDDKTQTIANSHVNNIMSNSNYPSNLDASNMGAVKLLSWSCDFTILASCWESGAIALWTTFGSLINFLSIGNNILTNNSFTINTMDWSIDSYFLTLHLSNNSKDKNLFENTSNTNEELYEISFVKFDQTVADLVFLHGFNYLLVSQMKKMSNYQGRYQKKHNISHNNWFVLTLPELYQLHDSHIKCVAVDAKSLNVAVACDKGYLIYNWNTQKWLNSTLNRHPTETIVCGSCVSWWERVLLLSIYDPQNPTKSSLLCHIINSKTNDNIEIVKEFDCVTVLQRINENNKLIIFGMDSNVNIYDLEMVYDSVDTTKKNISLTSQRMVSLLDIVPHPLTLVDLKIVNKHLTYINTPLLVNNESTEDDIQNEQASSPFNDSKNSCFLLNISGNLSSLNEINNENGDKSDSEHWQIIKEFVESFWTLDNFMWCFCGFEGFQLYVPKCEGDNKSTEKKFHFSSIHINLPNIFNYPIEFNTDTMLLHAVQSDFESGNNIVYKLNNTTTLLIPAIVLKLILKGHENEALKLIQNPILTIDNVVHNLEILMHDVLMNDFSNEALTSEIIFDIVVKFVMKFPEYLEIFCYCTRKIEMKLWPKLFSVVGSPEKLFVECIEKEKFAVASAYLVVINNVESASVNRKLYNMLLLELINHKKWKILRDVFNYFKNTCSNVVSTNNEGKLPISRPINGNVGSSAENNDLQQNPQLKACINDDFSLENDPKMGLHQSFDERDNIHDIDYFNGIIIGKADNFLSNVDILNLSYMLQASSINIKIYIEKKRDKFEELVSTPKMAYETLSKLAQIFSEFIQYFESEYQNKNVINSGFSEKTYKSQRTQIRALQKIFCECQLFKWATLFTILDYENFGVLDQTLASLKDQNFKTTPQQNYVDVIELIILIIDQLLQLGNVLSYRSRLWNNALSLKVSLIPKSMSYSISTSEGLDASIIRQSSRRGLPTRSNINSQPIFEQEGTVNFSKNSISTNILGDIDERIHADDNSLNLASSTVLNNSQESPNASATAVPVPDGPQGRCRIA